ASTPSWSTASRSRADDDPGRRAMNAPEQIPARERKRRPGAGVQIRRIVALARPQLPRLAVATVALLISSGVGLLFPQAVRYMVDALVSGTSPINFDTGAVLLVILF